MAATTKKLNQEHRFKYRSWCEDCQDGHQGGAIAAANWEYLHNMNHHEGDDA